MKKILMNREFGLEKRTNKKIKQQQLDSNDPFYSSFDL